MTQLNFYINGQQVEPPSNWMEIESVLHFDDALEGENVEPTINIDEFEWMLATNSVLRDWIADGVNNGGVGILEPPSLRIEIADGTNTQDTFNGIVDLSANPLLTDKNVIMTPVTTRDGRDRLANRARAISYSFLLSEGDITSADFKDIDYVLSRIPDYGEAATVALAIFGITKEIKEQIERVVSIIAEAVGLSAAGVTGSLGALLLVIAKLIIITIYFIAMTIALIQLTKDLLNSLISPRRTYKAMTLESLLTIGADKLGYTFNSSELQKTGWSDLLILPFKEKRPDKIDNETGIPTNRGQLYTVFDVFQFYKKLINGKVNVTDTEIQIERKDFFRNQSTYILPDALLNKKRYNTDEILANLSIEFSIDESDRNTIDQYVENKTNFQRTTKAKVVGNRRNVMIKGLEPVTLPVTLATRKEELTEIEEIVLVMAKLADGLVKIFNLFSLGNPQSLAALITDRKGVLLLNNDLVGVPKLIPSDGDGEMRSDYRDIINAEVLYNDYYFINTFVADVKNRNQEAIFENIDIPFCFADYLTVIGNDGFTTADGRKGRFTRLEANIDGRTANCDLRILEVYTNNLEDVIV